MRISYLVYLKHLELLRAGSAALGFVFCFFFLLIQIYLFIHERHRLRERGRDTGRGRSRCPSGSPLRDLIPDPGIMTRAEGGHPTAEPPRHPCVLLFLWPACLYVTWLREQLHVSNTLLRCIEKGYWTDAVLKDYSMKRKKNSRKMSILEHLWIAFIAVEKYSSVAFKNFFWFKNFILLFLKLWIGFFFFKILFIYSWETQRERGRHRQREEQVPRREPDVGLDPRTSGSGQALSWRQTLNHWATQVSLI